MITANHRLTLGDFAKSFGTIIEDIHDNCKDLISKTDFSYKHLNRAERDKIILDIMKIIDSESLIASGKERKSQWEKGWSESLQEFLDSGLSADSLIPKYMRTHMPVRLNQNYILPYEPNFEHYYSQVFRLWIFGKYLASVDSIYDFGCGTGYNLLLLSKLFPEKTLHGLDWTEASTKIVRLLAKKYKSNIDAMQFDFYSPNMNMKISKNSAILTFASLEQVGGNFDAFLQFILSNSPEIVINVECLRELYDESNLVDFLALKYHNKRNYLDGYLTRLRQLEIDGVIRIDKIQRTNFGNLYHEAYSFVVWRPL